MASNLELTDFTQLQRPNSPNTWLIAADGFAAVQPDESPPIFEMDPARLARMWSEVVESQPRTRLRAVSADGLSIEAEQRSAVFGFVDRISARIIPLAGGQSTIAAYSRSQLGYWDFGVNRARLRRWMAALQKRAATQREP